jgi:hypothetical protein
MNCSINSSSTDQVMGDCEGERTASRSAKKTSSIGMAGLFLPLLMLHHPTISPRQG